MSLTSINDLKERVQIFSYGHKESKTGEIKRTMKKLGSMWVGIKPCRATQSSGVNFQTSQTDDAQGVFAEMYHMTFRSKDVDFSGVIWEGKVYKRVSSIQKHGSFMRCSIARFEAQNI